MNFTQYVLYAAAFLAACPLLFGLSCDENKRSPAVPPPECEWQIFFGGSGYDYAHSVQQLPDNGYIVAGSAGSPELTGRNDSIIDLCVLRLDSSGGVEWNRTFGGSGEEYGLVVETTSDGGFIVVGRSDSTDVPGCPPLGDFDSYVVKLDDSGALQWQKFYGGNGFDSIRAVQQTPDNGYIAAGDSASTDVPSCTNNGQTDFHVLKLDSAGNVQWQKLIGGNASESCRSVALTADGGYVLAGESHSADIPGCPANGGSDVYVVKLDDSGAVEWQKLYGGGGGDTGRSIIEVSAGGYLFAGHSNSTDIPSTTPLGGYDCWVARLDCAGNMLWSRLVGGNGFDFECLVEEQPDGSFAIAGGSDSTDAAGCTNHGGYDCFIQKIGPGGAVEWLKMYGGADFDAAYWIRRTAGGGYVISGESWSTNVAGCRNRGINDFYIIKLDDSLDLLR